MRYPLILAVCFCFFSPKAAVLGQHYLGISGGGGINTDVLFRAAIPYEYSLSPQLSSQTELSYIQRENRALLQRLIGERNYRQAALSYLELPILLKAKMSVKSFSVYVLAGPKLGYGLRFSANYLEDSKLLEQRFDFDEEHIGRFDFGFNLGGGIEKRISKDRKIFIDYRFYLGLFDIDRLDETEVFNQGHVFNLGFLLPIRQAKNTKPQSKQ